MENELLWLQSFFHSYCNGGWEHEAGIRIETIDNPGWLVRINLKGTAVENIVFLEVSWKKNDTDWVLCRKQKNQIKNEFEGIGGPNNLQDIIDIFRNWHDKHFKM